MTSTDRTPASRASCLEFETEFDSDMECLKGVVCEAHRVTHGVEKEAAHNVDNDATHDVTEEATHDVAKEATHDVTKEVSNDVNKDSAHDAVGEASTDNVMEQLQLEGPLPNPPTAKPLKFGALVEARRTEIIRKLHTVQNETDMKQLYQEIDHRVAQAQTAKKPLIVLRLQLDKAILANIERKFGVTFKLTDYVIKRARRLKSSNAASQLELTAKLVKCPSYNRECKFGKSLDILQEIATAEAWVDPWSLHYNLATNALMRLKATNVGSDRLMMQGVALFERCRQCIIDDESNGQTYDIENRFYPIVMAAKLLLDLPEHTYKRQNDKISDEKIMKAQDMLKVICMDYPLPRMVIRFKLRLLITFAGLYFRRGQRATRDRNPTVAYSDFIHALLILECSSLLCADSPYEERELIDSFLKDLQQKCSTYHTASYKTSNGNIFHQNIDDSGSNHALDEPYVSEFDSDDIGNPTSSARSHKARKRRTKKARKHRNMVDCHCDSLFTSFTSTSSSATEPSFSADGAFHTISYDVLHRIELQHAAENTPYSVSSDNISRSVSSSPTPSAGTATLRMHHGVTIDEGYPLYESEIAVIPYKSPAATSSSTEPGFPTQHFKANHVIHEYQPEFTSGHDISYNYQYLTPHSVSESVFATRQTTDSLTTSSTYRMGILSEISFVRQFMSSHQNPRYDKEDLCIPLLVSAKLALDFPEYAANTSRFVISLSDLKSAFMTINVITESFPVDASSAMKSELLLIMASFYFRSAQFATKYSMPGTCKLCLNMAILYAEFAEVMTSRLDRKRRLRTVQAFHNHLCKLSACYLDKKDGSILLGVAQL